MVSLEPWTGGRFMETWDGGAALWAIVSRIEEVRSITLSGPMAMGEPVHGAWTWELVERDGGTRVTSVHRAFGLIGEEHERDYSAGCEQVADALKSHVEATS